MTSRKEIKNHINRELDKQIDIEKYIEKQDNSDNTKDKAKSLFRSGPSIREVAEKCELTFYAARKIWLSINKPSSPKSASEAVEKVWPSEAPEAPAEDEKPAKKKAPRIQELPTIQANLEPGIVHRFLISAAQDDTPVHTEFLRNMQAYAAYIGAHIIIGGHTYQLGLFEDHAASANVYDPELLPYLCHDRVQLTPDVLYLGSANVLPTTANPLNGWLTQNHGNHVIVPHSRIALQSIPRLQGQDPRFAIRVIPPPNNGLQK
ncbi:hypothetical protein [Brucella tritici]|uniref:Uncharacterized protein n=1 Tax=Brucella tritici TaxID=94626 RepID=A0A6L3Y7K2_9HYPH|nr:hypothetical protein [Brucella tritici]KAB2673632.1 hypothetical protein F9L08_29150 [Brucella tritici]